MEHTTPAPIAEYVAPHGAPVVLIHALIWHVRDALKLLATLPEGDDHAAVEEGLTEALNAAESWLM